ncbi:Re/Si-specific NAD(P)(+) transhydrogenase subunit alpha [Nisaea denitrificans]|uniref:Re/Si-specific NAD(P)(+) transhydrogenase subunit alpha n=1 Tax=Nisaea denitrificans TaxID=390877 RepID=UPI000400F8EA|nr:Re/Si-specific NAD(P)(+) transhydrogenase subunit alpha [Nisaea denitrificans]
MKIGIAKERRPYEARVAASPDTVKKYVAMGFEVAIETGAGLSAAFTDAALEAAGAKIVKTAKDALGSADVVLKVRKPIGSGAEVANEADEIALMKNGATLISLMEPYKDRALIDALAAKKITTFALEMVPRITRAQSMDVLSSQANLAGYKSVLDACNEFGRAFPMMMTAAGTVPPARVLVMGAGVAGLQAIATAKRLGAVVSATDVRPASKEQVESLGGTFVAVEDEEFKEAETAGGYAKEMSDAYKKKQAELIAETLKKQDVVICTALIPGRPAPVLITEDMVKTMKPGSVIVDLAVEQGGNCPLSEYGKVVRKHGVAIVGHANVPSRIAVDASALYAKNVLNFLTPLYDAEAKSLKINLEDEIVKGSLITQDGKVVHPAVQAVAAGKTAAKPAAKPRAARKPAASKTASKPAAKTAKAPAKPKAATATSAAAPAAGSDKEGDA